jgi:hypothetical protein
VGCSWQCREESFNLRKIRQCPDVKTQVHELQQYEERLHHRVRGFRKLVWRGQNQVARLRRRRKRRIDLHSIHTVSRPVGFAQSGKYSLRLLLHSGNWSHGVSNRTAFASARLSGAALGCAKW